jgi:hypothetical protein
LVWIAFLGVLKMMEYFHPEGNIDYEATWIREELELYG